MSHQHVLMPGIQSGLMRLLTAVDIWWVCLNILSKLYNKYIQILWLVLWRLCNWVKTTGYHKIAPTLKNFGIVSKDRLMIGIAKCLSPLRMWYNKPRFFLSGGRKHERVEVWGGQSRRRWDQLHVPSVYTSCTFRNRGRGNVIMMCSCITLRVLLHTLLREPSNT